MFAWSGPTQKAESTLKTKESSTNYQVYIEPFIKIGMQNTTASAATTLLNIPGQVFRKNMKRAHIVVPSSLQFD